MTKPFFSVLLLLHTFVLIATGQSVTITGVVSDQFGSLPGAKIVVEGTTIETATNVNGFYELNIDPGNYTLAASFVMYANQSHDIELSAGDSISLDFTLESVFGIEQDISVGTRGDARSLFESTVPVDVISLRAISSSPQIELGQILHYTVPSFHSTHQTISDGTDHIDPATLRGLGPDQVLVLINGKRRHTSSLLNVNGTIGRGAVGTDFNAIPFGAIDRIEILRDGAAAQYGSDAIAGVINIVLKEQTGVTNVDSQLGANTRGDGEMSFYSGNVGFDVGDGGYVNFTLEYRNREATNRSGRYTGLVYLNDSPIEDRELINSRDFFGNTGFEEDRVMEVGHSNTRNISFFMNAEVPISRTTSFYAHGGRNFRDGESAGFYRFPKDSLRVIHSLYPDGFSPRITTDIRDDAITVGFRGIKNSWNLDFSNTTGVNQVDFNIINSNNASLGESSPTRFYSGGFLYNQNITNLDVSRTFDWLKGITVAFGAEMRIENYEILSGEEASWINGMDSIRIGTSNFAREIGGQVFPGIQPENELNEFRTNNGWYIDAESRLTDDLLIGLAARYESYNDFGDELIWKMSSRYKLYQWVSFNAGFSTGFRAPSLHQVYFNNISTQFVDGEAVSVGTFNNESTVAQAFGIEGLRPELSRHLNAGLVAKFSKELSLTSNFYYIKIRDRIALTGRFSEGFEDILRPLNVGAAQFFTNAFDTKTLGLDLSATYRTELGGGQWVSTLAFNWTQTRLDSEIRASEELKVQKDTLFNREDVSRIESAQPNFKAVFLNSYQIGKFNIGINGTVFGELQYVHPEDANPADWELNTLTDRVESRDQTFSPKLVTDLMVSWQVSNNLKATIGGHNIFDVYPDKHRHSDNIDEGRFVYSRRVQQFGVRGAHYFARLSLKL